jgi:hypothetical protein
MVEETTAASHALSHETEQLTDLVDRFQLRRGASEAKERASPAPAHEGQRHSRRAASRP